MYIDKQTLSDLDIFKQGDTYLTVFDFIDRTQTSGGKYRLREKLLQPPEDIQKLKVQQEAVRFFACEGKGFVLPFSDRQIKSVERYISSNIDVVGSDRFFESLQFFINDIQAYREIKSSLKEVLAFIAAFQGSFSRFENSKLPLFLKIVANELLSLSVDKDFIHITHVFKKNNPYFFDVLKCDRFIRTGLKANLKKIISYYYEIDTLLSMALVGNENHFVFPEFAESDVPLFQAEALYHPLLKDAVPCNVELNKDSNFMFLTGPNMAGKTTFLKSVGIAVYLAHLGMAVPAVSLRISYFQRLFTSINIPDNVLQGYSYFFSEVKRVKQLAEYLAGGENVFSLFDELFKGTNLKDAYDASLAIISGLVRWQSSIVILSSHLWEIWDNIKKFPNAESFYFESAINNGVPVFSYRLVNGVSDARLGMAIVKNEKIMELLNPGKLNDAN